MARMSYGSGTVDQDFLQNLYRQQMNQATMEQEGANLPSQKIVPTQFPEQVNQAGGTVPAGPKGGGLMDALHEVWGRLTDQKKNYDPRYMSGMEPEAEKPEADEVGGRTVTMSPAEFAHLFKGDWGRDPNAPKTGVDQATGGAGVKSDAEGPVVHPPKRGSRPSSPGTTNGSEAATVQKPEGSSENAPKDPALAQLKDMFEKLDGKKGKLDLTPLLALTDAWTGSHMTQSYDRPLTDKQIESMKMQMAEQMARRQSDMEYHKALVDARLNGQQLRYDQGIYAADQGLAGKQVMAGAGVQRANIAADAKGAKEPPAITPQEKQLKGHYAPQVDAMLRSTYDDVGGGGKGYKGAAVEAHGQIMRMVSALRQQNPQAYPNDRVAYEQAIKDFPIVAQAPTGLKPRGAGKKGWQKEGGGGDAD